MAQLNINIEAVDLELFKQKVGNGNVTATIRNFILAYVSGDDLNDRKLRKQFEILTDEKRKIDIRFNKVKSRIDSIDQKRKAEDLVKIEAERKEREKMQMVEHETNKANLSRMV